MTAIYKAPGCPPEFRDIPDTLEALQEAVGGRIETVTLTTDSCIICNEEGRLQGLPHNVRFLGVDFCGPILIVGIDGDEFCSLQGDCKTTLFVAVRWAWLAADKEVHHDL